MKKPTKNCIICNHEFDCNTTDKRRKTCGTACSRKHSDNLRTVWESSVHGKQSHRQACKKYHKNKSMEIVNH